MYGDAANYTALIYFHDLLDAVFLAE